MYEESLFSKVFSFFCHLFRICVVLLLFLLLVELVVQLCLCCVHLFAMLTGNSIPIKSFFFCWFSFELALACGKNIYCIFLAYFSIHCKNVLIDKCIKLHIFIENIDLKRPTIGNNNKWNMSVHLIMHIASTEIQSNINNIIIFIVFGSMSFRKYHLTRLYTRFRHQSRKKTLFK